MRREPGDLGLQAAHEVRIDAGELAGRLVEALGDSLEPRLQAADRLVTGTPVPAAVQRLGEGGEALVDRLHDGSAVQRGVRLALLELFGDVVEAALELAEEHIALFERVFLAALEQVGQHVEALFDAGEYLTDVGHARSVVDLVGDDRDLVGEPLDRLVRHGGARRQFVDPPRQRLEMFHHLDARAVLGNFLDLPGERRDACLDPLEGLGIDMLLLGGDRGADYGAGNLVEPLLDMGEGLGGAAALLLDEMVKRAGKRAHLVLQRVQRQQFGQVPHGLADLLHAVGQRRKLGVVSALCGAGRNTVLEIVEALVEGVPAAIGGAHRLFARKRVERCLHLFDLQPEHGDALVVGAVAERLDRARQPLEVEPDLAHRLAARRVALLEILAQRVELAAQARRHLVAQFLAQSLQFAGDLAESGDAVLILAHALDVAGDRLVGLIVGAAELRRTRPDGLALEALAVSGGADLRLPAMTDRFLAVALDPLLQRLEGAVELLQRCVGPSLPAGVDCVEVGSLAVHRNARSPVAGRGPVPYSPRRVGRGPQFLRRKRAPGRDALAPKDRENKSLQDKHGDPTRAQFLERGKQGVNHVYELASFVKKIAPGASFALVSAVPDWNKLPQPLATMARLHRQTTGTIGLPLT